jgi:hypothetical protein
MMKKPKKTHDWESIEKEYRLGQTSIRIIATKFGISHTAINKKIKKENWVQNKSTEVLEKTKAGLIGFQEGVSKPVSNPTPEDIEKAVQTNIQVVINHRKDISKALTIVGILSEQLKEVAENRSTVEDLIIKETKGKNGDKPNLRKRNFMLKAVSLPVHAGVVRDLSMALSKLVPLERQAFSLDDSEGETEDLKSTLTPAEKKLFRKAARIVSQRVIEQAHE